MKEEGGVESIHNSAYCYLWYRKLCKISRTLYLLRLGNFISGYLIRSYATNVLTFAAPLKYN